MRRCYPASLPPLPSQPLASRSRAASSSAWRCGCAAASAEDQSHEFDLVYALDLVKDHINADLDDANLAESIYGLDYSSDELRLIIDELNKMNSVEI